MSRLDATALLALHRELVATPSVSGDERAAAELVASWLDLPRVRVERIGDSVLALAGQGPLLLLDTHLDTVPPAPGWTRPPFEATVEGGRVYGLGANDAKASVAAMLAAFRSLITDIQTSPLGLTLALALVAGEETKSQGTRDVLDWLEKNGLEIFAAVVGEPTGLDLAIAQKGLLVLELVADGQAAHAAHARTLGVPNAAFRLAHDLVALEEVDLGPSHPLLGATTLEPTVVRAGTARNVVPAEASAILDVRTTPATRPAEVVARVRAAVAGEIRIHSDRFAPRQTVVASAIVDAATAARPEAMRYGSATLSDWALLSPDVPAIKVGPGRSERSHRPDELVLESEVVDGARFYELLVRELATRMAARVPVAHELSR
jgi:acetylornithine deacetylase